MNNSIKLGVILGVISAVLTIIMGSVLSPHFFFSGKSVLISSLISILVLIFLGRIFLRKDVEQLSYGEALKWLFLAYIVSSVISLVVTTAMYQNNTEMQVAFEDYIVRTQELTVRKVMQLTGESEEEIQLALDKIKDEMESQDLSKQYPFKFSKLPINMFNSAIFGIIMSLIAAIFVKMKGAGDSIE